MTAIVLEYIIQLNNANLYTSLQLAFTGIVQQSLKQRERASGTEESGEGARGQQRAIAQFIFYRV